MSMLANFDVTKIHVQNTADIGSLNANSLLIWDSEWITLTDGLNAAVKTPFKKITGAWVIGNEVFGSDDVQQQILTWTHGATAGDISVKVYTTKTSNTKAELTASNLVRIRVIAKAGEQLNWSMDMSKIHVLNPPDIASMNADTILYYVTEDFTLTGTVDAIKTPFTKIAGAWVISNDGDDLTLAHGIGWQHSATAKCIDVTGFKISSTGTIAASTGKVRLLVMARFSAQPAGALDLTGCVCDSSPDLDSVNINSKLSFISEAITTDASGVAQVKLPFRDILGMHVITSDADVETYGKIVAWAKNATAGTYDLLVVEYPGADAASFALANAKTFRVMAYANYSEQL